MKKAPKKQRAILIFEEQDDGQVVASIEFSPAIKGTSTSLAANLALEALGFIAKQTIKST